MEKDNKISTLVLALNTQATKLMNEANHETALSKLDQAVQFLLKHDHQDNSNLYSITYSNYGLIFKKTKELEKALNCFIIASKYCRYNPELLGQCQLRICSVYAKLKNHKKALKHALKALKALENSNTHIKIIAYQNAGAEYEHLDNKPEAMNMYFQGYSFVKMVFGCENKISQMFKQRYNDLKKYKKEKVLNLFMPNPQTIKTSQTPELKKSKFGEFPIASKHKILYKTSKTPAKLNSNSFLPSFKPQLTPGLKPAKKYTFKKRLNFDGFYMVDSLSPSLVGSKNLKPFSINLEQSK